MWVKNQIPDWATSQHRNIKLAEFSSLCWIFVNLKEDNFCMKIWSSYLFFLCDGDENRKSDTVLLACWFWMYLFICWALKDCGWIAFLFVAHYTEICSCKHRQCHKYWALGLQFTHRNKTYQLTIQYTLQDNDAISMHAAVRTGGKNGLHLCSDTILLITEPYLPPANGLVLLVLYRVWFHIRSCTEQIMLRFYEIHAARPPLLS